jgi:hypothetical protein
VKWLREPARREEACQQSDDEKGPELHGEIIDPSLRSG